MAPTLDLYNYKGIVTSVYDGDTVTVVLQLGLDVELKNQKLRLYGINTPEMKGATKEKAIAARDYLASLVLNKEVLISTYRDKREKFGRYLAEIWLPDLDKSVNQIMVDEKYAVKYEC